MISISDMRFDAVGYFLFLFLLMFISKTFMAYKKVDWVFSGYLLSEAEKEMVQASIKKTWIQWLFSLYYLTQRDRATKNRNSDN